MMLGHREFRLQSPRTAAAAAFLLSSSSARFQLLNSSYGSALMRE